MTLRFRTRLIASLLLALLAVSTPTASQDRFYGYERAVEPLQWQDFLDSMVLATLSDGQKRFMLSRYQSYLEGAEAIRDRFIASANDAQAKAIELPRTLGNMLAHFKALRRLGRNAARSMGAHDRVFYDECASVLAEDQYSTLDIVRGRRQRRIDLEFAEALCGLTGRPYVDISQMPSVQELQRRLQPEMTAYEKGSPPFLARYMMTFVIAW